MSTGWREEYIENRKDYIKIFDECLTEKYEGDTTFLEKHICKKIGVKHSQICMSGTDAITFALQSLNLQSDDEVLVSSFSWISSASPVQHTGAIPVICDIDLDTYHMSLNSIIEMTSKKTKAIIYPHLFGNMSDTTEIIKFCKENNIIFIEDACQAIGASYKGTNAGTIGDVSCLSFNSNKNIAGISGGGSVLSKNIYYTEKAREFSHPMSGGKNSKMLIPNARIIDYRLRYMEKWQLHRQILADIYNEAFENLPIFIQNDENVNHNYHKYVVRFETSEIRNDIHKKLNQNGIPAAIHYPNIIEEQLKPGFITNGSKNARIASETVLTLPLNHMMKKEDIKKIIKIMTNDQ
jgi:hypothetical protein